MPRKPRSNGKHPGGRPPLLTPQLAKKISDVLRLGAPKETAAAFAGITKETLYDWLRQGAKALETAKGNLENVPEPDQPYAQFSDSIGRAFAEGEVNLLGLVHRAARPRKRTVPVKERVTDKAGKTRTVTRMVEVEEDGEWQAATWLLERTRQMTYARRVHTAVEGVQGGAPIVIQKVDMDIPEEGA